MCVYWWQFHQHVCLFACSLACLRTMSTAPKRSGFGSIDAQTNNNNNIQISNYIQRTNRGRGEKERERQLNRVKIIAQCIHVCEKKSNRLTVYDSNRMEYRIGSALGSIRIFVCASSAHSATAFLYSIHNSHLDASTDEH